MKDKLHTTEGKIMTTQPEPIESLKEALKPKLKTCGSCHQEIHGLFRDHSFETCITSICRERDSLKKTNEELLEAAKKAKTLVDILVKLYPDGHEHDLSFKLTDGSYSDCIWCDAIKSKVSLTQAITHAEGK